LGPKGEENVSNIAAANCEDLDRLFTWTQITQQVGGWRITGGVEEGPEIDMRRGKHLVERVRCKKERWIWDGFI